MPGNKKTEEFASPSAGEPSIYFDDLIAIYTAFRDHIYSPQSVLYPSCGFDGSPARVFTQVTFVDVENGNEGCIKRLVDVGLHAIKQDIQSYSPTKPHDLLILLNAAIPTAWASKHLISGGFVLTNDYQESFGNA